MLLYCIFIVLTISALFKWGTMHVTSRGESYFIKTPVLAGMAIFTLWVGLRYNMKSDPDFDGYWDIVESGSSNFYYDHFEIIPRLCIDLVYNYRLPTSVWFILMGAFLAVFTTIAARRNNGKHLVWVFISFILLYLTFDMNVIRQGIALSAMLCAFTYISERKWKHYLCFAILAFCFHRTSIVWVPMYLLTYLDLEKNAVKKYFIAILVIAVIMTSLLYFMSMFSFVFNIMQMEDKLQYRLQGGTITEIIEVRSGLGIALRYVRWLVVCYYISKIMKYHSNRNELHILFMIFIMGVVLDYFTMYEIGLSRSTLYAQIVEILLLPYLVEYCKLRKKDYQLLLFVLIFQFVILGYQIGLYFSRWDVVSIL